MPPLKFLDNYSEDEIKNALRSIRGEPLEELIPSNLEQPTPADIDNSSWRLSPKAPNSSMDESIEPIEGLPNQIDGQGVLAAPVRSEDIQVPTEEPTPSIPPVNEIPTESYGSAYRKAQDASSLAQLTNRLGAAGELIGSSIAGAKPIAQEQFAKQAEDSKSIESNFLQGVDFEEKDPNSAVSKVARTRALKLFPGLAQMQGFELVSAKQLKDIGFKESATTDKGRYQRMKYKDQSGTPRIGIFDSTTSQRIMTPDDPLDIDPLSIVSDPLTQNVYAVNRNNPDQRKTVFAPKAPSEESIKTNKVDWDSLNKTQKDEFDKIKTEFIKESDDFRTASDRVDGLIDKQIDLAMTNATTASQLGAMVSEIFEPTGVKTDQDVKRYIERSGLLNKIRDLPSRFVTGKLTASHAKELKEGLKEFKKTINDILARKAKRKSAEFTTKHKELKGKDATELLIPEYNSSSSSTNISNNSDNREAKIAHLMKKKNITREKAESLLDSIKK